VFWGTKRGSFFFSERWPCGEKPIKQTPKKGEEGKIESPPAKYGFGSADERKKLVS